MLRFFSEIGFSSLILEVTQISSFGVLAATRLRESCLSVY